MRTELVKSQPDLPEKQPHVAETQLAPYYGYDVNAPDVEENSAYTRLREYWLALRKHIWLVLGICALATLLASVYVARQPDIYEARARVEIGLEVAPPPLTGSKATNFVFSQYQDPTYFNTQIQLLTSAGLLQRVAKTLDLEHNPAFLGTSGNKPSTWDSLKRMFGFGARPQTTPAPYIDQKSSPIAAAGQQGDLNEINRMAPVVDALSGVIVKEVENTRLIEIRYRHTEPEIATKIVNTLAETLQLSNMERRADTSNSSGDFLQKRIAQLQNDIRGGEEKLNNYAKDRQIISLQPENNPTLDRLAGLNKQLLEAENARKEAEATYNAHKSAGAVEAQIDTSDKQGATTAANQQIAESEAKLSALKQKRAELLEEYTAEWPEVKQVESQIAIIEQDLTTLRARVSGLRTNAVSSVKKNYEVAYRLALEKEQNLRRAYEAQRGETLQQNEAATGYRIMQQEIDANRQMLSNLLEQQKTGDVITSAAPNNIRVVDYAPKPRGPVGPRRMPFVALACILSLVFGIALARYLDYLDDAVHSVEEVEKYVRLPALAVIPSFGGRRGLFPKMTSSVTALQRRRDAGSEELLIYQDGRSPLAEAYRQLRTSILLSSAGGAPKSLLVTSSQPSEGKTTTVVNTATILAQAQDTRVIIIDADMRRPRLHSLFSLPNQAGLSTILSSRMDEAEMLAQVQHYADSNLYLLPSGPVPPNPAELLGSQQMRQLLGVLEKHFSHVIVDSPPIVSFTDAVLIATLTDGVLLVVEAGRTSRNLVRRSRQLLLDVGAKIFGVVLNNLDIKSRAYYNYNGYYYQHYYENTDKD